MKKILFLMIFMAMSICGLNAQTQTCCYFDGYWSSWKLVDPSVSLYGNWESFIMYDTEGGDKWDPQFKVTINNFSIPPKKQRKKDVKATPTVWYEFEGIVEYNMAVGATMLDYFRKFKDADIPDKTAWDAAEIESQKIKSRAIIKIQAFEKQPSCYNIYFDNVGIGFSFKAPNWKVFND